MFLSLAPIPQLAFRASLTRLTTRVAETDMPLRNRPKWRGGLGMDIILSPKINLRSRLILVGSRLDFQVPTQTTRVDGYAKADVTLNYHPFPAWHWYVALENVTNTSYEEFEGFPAPPITFRIGLEYRP